jgi:anaerobic selenocysteine-containing dehydrogenase
VYEGSGPRLPHGFKKQFNLYVETVAQTRHSYTGRRFSGIAPVEPVKSYADEVVVDSDFPLRLITYKHITGGQSRTVANPWLDRILPQNPVLINRVTAERMGLQENDEVRLVSATNPEGEWDLKNGDKMPMIGRAHVIEGIHPEVVAVSWHFGHWAYGANSAVVDGVLVEGDPRRRDGICPNAALRLDPTLGNSCLEDLIGGSSSFYDTRVALVRA